jgi:hypothetical protein
MQILTFRYYEKRILYYWAKLHQQQFHEGQDYLELKPTLSISFLDHVLFPEVQDHHLRFRLVETAHRFPFSEDLELHLLELPKFRKTAGQFSAALDLWLYFLRHAENMDIGVLSRALQRPPEPPALEELALSADEDPVDTASFLVALQQHPQQQPLVLRALEELMKLAQTDAERERYEARRKAQLDYNTGLKVARMEGREEGRQEGRSEGRAEGEIIGRIHLCERLLKRPVTATEQLLSRSLEELTQLADDLQGQVLKE